MNIIDILKSWPLYILPHHFISRLVFRLTRIQCPTVVPGAIRLFSDIFKVNLEEARNPDPASYQTFNAFFTRPLRPELRPVAEGDNVLVSPVDGRVSQMGRIEDGRIFQAKGHYYSALELLGGDENRAAAFMNGQFMTIYLSPRDYHRIHMPLSGKLLEQVYVPGRLFSVAGHTARTIPRLFARNERVVAVFDTEFGKLAMVLVGAINVAAIETVWDGLVTPPQGWGVKRQVFADVALAKGAEMGRFNMGSTVILLLENGNMQWESILAADQPLKLGERLASW
ncbi:MAG TPA: archaetidylserine decarboxylase [Candidatus Thiothrix moscowensis]|uniref:archaetidylserine decarboxylase n=1 Tax=unclassified Thiothrix TaxID=2636184 RepID=UPI0025FA57C2|nr:MULTISPECIES: archaetidylserine decarboxylase [unclassified Thiothrix]HRJ54509.1 archaetidylserine decarboxylase [Candidatus Thiothrix moscowensis]HRJ94868.1 archaetidylserine decarboxylase [Candidatus Thiothrix moscowensis]